MNDLKPLGNEELIVLQEIEATLIDFHGDGDIQISDYPVCVALLKNRPIPTKEFRDQLALKTVQTKVNEVKRRPLYTRTRKSWGRWLILLTVLITISILVSTPQFKSLAQEIITLFEREDESSIPESRIINTNVPEVRVDLEDADDRLGFHLEAPTFLPSGFAFTQVEIHPDLHTGILTYDGPASTSGVMSPQLVIRQSLVPFEERIGPDAEIISVSVGPYSGEYVEGGWIYLGDHPDNDPESEKIFSWEKSLVPMQRLRWKSDIVYFEIRFVGSDTADGYLNLNDLIRVAESLK